MTAPAASAVVSPATEDLARTIAVRKKDGRTVAYHPRKILNDLNSAERVFGVEFHASKAQLVETVTRRAA